MVDSGVNSVEKPNIPNLDQLKQPTDTWKTRRFSNLGGKIRKTFESDDPNQGAGAFVTSKLKKMGAAYSKFREAPPKKTSKSEACFWVAVICAVLAIAVFAGLTVAMGPGGLLFALQFAMIPGVVGGGFAALGLRERKKEHKLKEWETPKLKYQPHPMLSDEENGKLEKEFRVKGETLWKDRNTAKFNMEENQRQITALKIKLIKAQDAKPKQPTETIQAQIDERNNKKLEYFKDFEDKAVAFWSHANPDKGAQLKERFDKARKERGENLSQIEDLTGSEIKGNLPES